MKKFIATMATAGVLLVVTASGASAAPTCQNESWDNHGEHITEDYVNGDGAGGGAPAHFGSGHQPGASFCLEQAQSKPVDPEGRRS
ncbi:MAG TPA: hypothetical protein VGA13_10175 [Acidimicrobiales bacterium]